MTLLFMGDAVVTHESLRHMGGGEDATEGVFAIQIGGRADAGQHGRGHVTQHQRHIALLIRQMLGQLHSHGGFAGAGAAPYRQHLIFILRLLFRYFFGSAAGENTVFDEIHA